MRGKRAKEFGNKVKNNPHYDVNVHGIHWQGCKIDRLSADYQRFLLGAYMCVYTQCPKFRAALKATGIKRIYHTIGNASRSAAAEAKLKYSQSFE